MPNKFPCIRVQESPNILSAVIPGHWLLKKTTPSWRIKEPELGFQRMVSEDRARAIAVAVLDQRRSFPNSIVLATDVTSAKLENGDATFPDKIQFLVVDGQHRLWAQKYSEYAAQYSCVIHFGLSEKEMAALFVEINDNQKRVPSSLRWDLVRLVRPEAEPKTLRAADLVYELATTRDSALYQRVDLTGEQPAITLKQGSVAPAIKSAISSPRSPLKESGYEIQLKVVIDYIAAMRECDADGWDKGSSPFYGARVFRAAFRLLPDLITKLNKPIAKLTANDFYKYLTKVKLKGLDPEVIRAQQGTAGIKAIYLTLRKQALGY